MENPNGAVSGNSQNVPSANVPRTRSTFDLKYHFFDTHRFGEYHPHYVEDGVKDDVLPIRSSHNVLSYTLKSPLLQNITLYKDYFSVPMESILPLNWEKFFDNPVRGDDVSVDVGCCVEEFWKKVGTLFSNLRSAMYNLFSDPSSSITDCLTAYFRYIIIGEYFYSNGSLLTSLGDHGAPNIIIYKYNSSTDIVSISYDTYFDEMIQHFIDAIETNVGTQPGDTCFSLTVDGYSYTVSFGTKVRSQDISLRHALCLMRDNPTFYITSYSTSPTTPPDAAIKSQLLEYFYNNNANHTYGVNVNPSEVPVNLSRLWAYQLCCAHYYSNDHIDFVYSAELFRQLIGNYIYNIATSFFHQRAFFTRNGIKYQYDYLSAHFIDYVLTASIPSTGSNILIDSNSSLSDAKLGYLSALFGYRRSLRYLDYFTGSRAQPLAVGSTGVTVSGNTVDVVDITRNIQRQRFLNAVNRVRHNFEGYLQGIFGGDVPAPDYHNPFFLASTQDDIYGQETENTGAAQMSSSIAITTNLRSNGARYMLEIHCDRPCIVIGITHYDLPRVYSKSVERAFFVKDRFDMFNPFMQYIGDQPIYVQELGLAPNGVNQTSLLNFSYTLRDMQYKQRFNQAAGGFVENLPGFAFLAMDDRGSQININPDWIRSVTSEFDDFYVSLNGWSNGSYFHFIVDNYNDCSGSRPMAYAPSIL